MIGAAGTDDHSQHHDDDGHGDETGSGISIKPLMSLYFWSIVTALLVYRFTFFRSSFSSSIPMVATVMDAIDYVGLSIKWLFIKAKMMMPFIKFIIGKVAFVLAALIEFV